MAAKEKTRFAILGLLSWQSLSGYDIKKLIEMGLQHFWNESYGQLYPSLNQLARDGLVVRKQDAAGGRRKRHIYTITARGRRAFVDWLHETTAAPKVRNEFLLKFFLAGRLKKEEGIRLLTAYRVKEQERWNDYSLSEKVLRSALRHQSPPEALSALMGPNNDSNQLLVFLLTLRHGILMTEARLAWCDEALKALGHRQGRKLSPKGMS